MCLKLLLGRHLSHKWKQIRDCDYRLLWSGTQRLVWTMAVIIIILSGWKLGHPEELTHSDCEVDVKHQKRLDLFWNLIENFTRSTTSCRCAPYCEVELLKPIAHIRSYEPSLWFCSWRALNFRPCEYCSEFCIEVLIWCDKDLNLLVEAADGILFKWNCRYLCSYSVSPFGARPKAKSEFRRKTSNSKWLLRVFIPISSIWSWDARLTRQDKTRQDNFILPG